MARSKNVPRRHGNRSVVSMLLLRQDGLCFYCTKPIYVQHEGARKATLDHKTPLALGGEPFGDNVVAACRLCNAMKGPLDAETFLAVRGDHQQRRALITEIQLRILAMSAAERTANRQRIKEQTRESLAALQVALGEVVRAHRRALQAAPEPLRRGAGGRQI